MVTPPICLFRHGETQWNSEGRFQGQLNSPLTSRGKLQARNNARCLQRQSSLAGPFTVYASPLGRAKETAIIMLDELGISADTITYDDRLMEASFGECEGLTEAEVAKSYPDFWQARTADRWIARPPSGESYSDLNSRVSEWYEDVELSQTTLVVCHAMTSRVMRGIYTALPHEEIVSLTKPHDGFFKLSHGNATHMT